MQLDDVLRARGLVQPVHVLGDDPAEQAAPLQLGHGLVARLGAARAMCRQPRWLRAQYRCRAAAAPVNAWYVIGSARRARPVGPR